MFLADDCLILIKAELSGLEELRRILETYENLAGQQINFGKSEISGSKKVDEIMLRLCENFLEIKVVQNHSKYLGLQLVVGQNKKEAYKDIEDKIQRKIQNWSSIILSNAGRETLIKSVLKLIPLYSMSCFRLPKSLGNRLSANAIHF